MRLTRAFHEDFVHTIPTRPQALQCPPCTGRCNQGRNCPANACAIEGGKHREPVSAAFDRMPEPDGWFVAVLGMGCVVAVAACAVLVLAFA